MNFKILFCLNNQLTIKPYLKALTEDTGLLGTLTEGPVPFKSIK
jgi:hypothetical protein